MLTATTEPGALAQPFLVPLHQVAEHPQAGLVPLMRPEEYAEFLADIEARGIEQPVQLIQLREDPPFYQILDGRHRTRAARVAGHESVPAVVVELPEGETAVEWMVRQALLRRHLTDDQRAVLAIDLQKQLSREARAERGQRAGQSSAKARATESLSGTLPDKLQPEGVRVLDEPADEPEFAEVSNLERLPAAGPAYPLDPHAPLEQQPRSGYAWRLEREVVVDALPLCEYAAGVNRADHPARYRTASGGKHYCATHIPGGAKRLELLVLLDEAAPLPHEEPTLFPPEAGDPALMVQDLDQEHETRHLPPGAWQDQTVHHQIRRLVGLIQFARQGATRAEAIRQLESDLVPPPAAGAAKIDWRTLTDNGLLQSAAGKVTLQIGGFLTLYDEATARKVCLTILEDGCELRCWEDRERRPTDPLLEAWIERTDGPRWTPTAYIPSVRKHLQKFPHTAAAIAFQLTQEHKVTYAHIRDTVVPALVACGVIEKEGPGEKSPYRLVEKPGAAGLPPKKRDTRREAAELVQLPPESRKIRQAAQLEKTAPDLLPAVKTGEMTLREANKEASKRQAAEHQAEREERAAEVRATEGNLGRIVFSLQDVSPEEGPFDLVVMNPHSPWMYINWEGRFDPTTLHPYLSGTSQILVFGGTWHHAHIMAEWCQKAMKWWSTEMLFWHATTDGGEQGYPYDSYPHDVEMILWMTGEGPYAAWKGRRLPRMEKERRSSLIVGPRKDDGEWVPRHETPRWLLEKLLARHVEPGAKVLVLDCGTGRSLQALEQYGCRYVGVESQVRKEYWKGWAKLTRCELPARPEQQATKPQPDGAATEQAAAAGEQLESELVGQLAEAPPSAPEPAGQVPPCPLTAYYQERTLKNRSEALAACKRVLRKQAVSSKKELVRLVAAELGIVQEDARYQLEQLESEGKLERETPGKGAYRVAKAGQSA